MTKRKSSSEPIRLPPVTVERTPSVQLPFNGRFVAEVGFSLSFSAFDRSHEFFNLGDSNPTKTLEGAWFIDLLDCLKSVTSMTVENLQRSPHKLHPIDFSKTNLKKLPKRYEQCEFWQFRINKSKGRVIGVRAGKVFYVVWLDPHHNLTNSEGYGKIDYYPPGKSAYELLQEKIANLQEEIANLQEELEAYKELFSEKN